MKELFMEFNQYIPLILLFGAIAWHIVRNEIRTRDNTRDISKIKELVPLKENEYRKMIDDLKKEVKEDIADVKAELKKDHDNLASKVDKALIILAKLEGKLNSEENK